MITILNNWFNGLSPREQLIVQAGLPIAVLIICLLGLKQLQGAMAAARDTHQNLLQQYRWLRTETAATIKWRARFGRRNLGELHSAAELGSLLNDGLQSYRLRGTVRPDGNHWQITLQPSDGNSVLAYIEAAVGTGAAPTLVKLTRADNQGKVSGVLVFAPLVP